MLSNSLIFASLLALTTTAPALSAAIPSPVFRKRDANVDALNVFRSSRGLPNLSFSSDLEADVQATLSRNPGQFVHWLGPYTWAQIFDGAPCGANPIDVINDMAGEAGNVEDLQILTDSSYTQVACGCLDNVWACDFGY